MLVYEIRCDGCDIFGDGANGRPGVAKRLRAKLAINKGWKRVGSQDLCPSCFERKAAAKNRPYPEET